MPQYDGDLPVGVNPLIIVIVQFGSGNPVSGKKDRAVEFSRIGKGNGHEVFRDLQVLPVELQFVIGSNLGAGCQFERLEVRIVVAHRTKAPQPKLRCDIVSRLVQFG